MNFKYIFITLLIVGAGATGYLFLRTGNTPDEQVIDTYAIEEELDAVEELIQEEDASGIAGSCNAIADSSTCIEYSGSLYKSNNMAGLNCSDAGTFSHDPCPSTRYGGCQTGSGTNVEMTAYMYPEGGGEIDDESIGYARMACEANGLGVWVQQ